MSVAAQRGRLRWWYAAIADTMLANPQLKIYEIAKELNKHPNSVYLITESDAFKQYFAERRAAMTLFHDTALSDKSTKVAMTAMDAILAVINKKKDSIPLRDLNETAKNALTALGYGRPPQAGAPLTSPTQVIGTQNIQVSINDITEAREAIRSLENRKLLTSLPPDFTGSGGGIPEVAVVEAEEVLDLEGRDVTFISST